MIDESINYVCLGLMYIYNPNNYYMFLFLLPTPAIIMVLEKSLHPDYKCPSLIKSDKSVVVNLVILTTFDCTFLFLSFASLVFIKNTSRLAEFKLEE